MPNYTHTTFGQAKDHLASLLGDSGKVFYSDSELGSYIREAVSFWGLAAQYWRKTLLLRTVPGQAFYDITSSAVTEDWDTQLPIPDRQIINDILIALMEPPISSWQNQWPGTEQFNLSQISTVLANSRDDILRQSGCMISEQVIEVTPGVQRVSLPESDQGLSTSSIVRASIQEMGGPIIPMYAIDFYQAQATVDTASWPAVGRPKAYTITHTPLLALDLWPSPANSATLRLYTQRVGGALDPQNLTTLIALPYDANWLLKYRAMEDLLASDGIAKAPEMSDYCRTRWQQGMELFSIYNSIIWAEIGGKRLTISSQAQLDSSRMLWQNTLGQPKSVQQLSWNMISLYPVPDAQYIITLDCVVNAPKLVNESDYLDISSQYLQAIYDYAQHIAMFKIQGAEFANTMSLYEDTVKTALEHQANIAATSINYAAQLLQTRADRIMRPVRRPELVAEAQQIVGSN